MSLKQRIEHLEQHIFGRVDPRGHGDDGDLESGLREMHDEWRGYKDREAQRDQQPQDGQQQADPNAKPPDDLGPGVNQTAADELRESQERHERENAEMMKASAAGDTAEKHDE